MRFGTKAAIMAAFAGPAIAALILTGAGSANAAVTSTTTPHATTSASDPIFPFCSSHNLERWDFRGDNTVYVTYDGGNYTYTVHFDQSGSCLSGWLNDPGITSGPRPIHGTVFRNHVTFSFTYPTDVQGTRTYSGTISPGGSVSGTWSQTGYQVPNNGTWSLAHAVRRACPSFYPWLGFFQTGNGCPVPFPYRFYY